MKRSRFLACYALILAITATIGGIALAPAQQPAMPPKDRKDLLIESLERQRNGHASQVAICESAYNEQVPALQTKITELTAEVEKLKKAADDAKPADKATDKPAAK